MNILCIILYCVGGLIALLLIIPLFTKKAYIVERAVTIAKPLDEVFAYVLQLKYQNQYNKWWMVDPNAKKDYRGTDGTVGFVAAWDSENKQLGKGEVEIMSIQQGERIAQQVRFERPFKNIADTAFTFKALNPNQTKVAWTFAGKFKYPLNLMLLIMNMDKMLGNDQQETLENLRKILENN